MGTKMTEEKVMYKPLIFHYANEFTMVLKKEVHPNLPPIYKIGIAFCHPKDQFCKRIGRQIANGRVDLQLEWNTLDDCLLELYGSLIEIDRVRSYTKESNISHTPALARFVDHVKEVARKLWEE